jgi:nucleoside-diphosphate kinase
MYDLKNKRSFLKRTLYPDLKIEDLRIGSTISIFSRPLKIVEYGDAYTRSLFDQQKSNTFAMILPDAYQHIGSIITAVYGSGLSIKQLKMVRLS